MQTLTRGQIRRKVVGIATSAINSGTNVLNRAEDECEDQERAQRRQ